MKLHLMAIALAAAFAAGCASSSGGGSGMAGGVHGEQFESCECDTYCPCIFSKDTTYGDCRVLMAWRVGEGSFGGTDLKGVAWAAAVTKSGRNVDKALGKFEGVLYLPESATEAQRKAIGDLMKKEMGAAFAKREVKTNSISIKGEPGHYELKIGQVANLKISPLKGANGQVPVIENAPSPLALPKEYCGKADVHTYSDGAAKWDFAGRNAFWGPFAMGAK